MIKFNEDGTLRVGRALDDLDLPPSKEHPGAVEAWTYDGMVVTFQVVEYQTEGMIIPAPRIRWGSTSWLIGKGKTWTA